MDRPHRPARRHVRVSARLPVRYGPAGPAANAWSRNVSERGIYIDTDYAYNVTARLSLAVESPSLTFTLRGEVIWAKRRSPNEQAVGIQGMGLELLRPGHDWLQFCREEVAASQGLTREVDRRPAITQAALQMANKHRLELSCEWLDDRVALDEQLICTLRMSVGADAHEVPFFSDHVRNYEKSSEIKRAVDSKLEYAIQALVERGH